ncbi:MAG: MotA/TolQ/ExbB proton channel family protein [Sphingomonadales bacterium]|nr:MAG: MotA/TolQ/ExbB proton channel family protein [Sphingomonadales bacterium]
MADVAAAAGENPYGLMAALKQGGIVAQGTFGIMVIMSLGSWFIMITKYLDQRKIMAQGKELEKKFWTAPSLREGANRLDKDSAFRQIVEDGLRAADHHDGKLTDKIDAHEWITMSLERSVTAITSRLQGGLAFLASTGSTAPFIGLFGTVVGIYRALINISLAGQASIDKVAGPVGEALIMTALGLAVAVPAVLGYNALTRRNKALAEKLGHFASDVHAHLMSGARMAQKAPAAPAAAAATAVKK